MVDSDDDDDLEVLIADRARLLDSYAKPAQPDLVAARAAIAPYLEDIDSHMRSLEVRVSRFLFSSLRTQRAEIRSRRRLARARIHQYGGGLILLGC